MERLKLTETTDVGRESDVVVPPNGDALRGPLRGPVLPVDDPADPRLSVYRDLNDPASRRRVEADGAIFVVEGKLAVRQLLASDYRVQSLLVDDRQVTAGADLVAAVRDRGAPVYVGPRSVVLATVGFALHRGVVAVAHRPPAADAGRVLAEAVRKPSVGGGRPLVAVLEGLNDHENIGAMFRNAAAFGVGGVLLDPTCGDPLYRRSVRVSMGHVLRVPFARLTPWPEAVAQVRSAGFLVVALAPHSGSGVDGTADAAAPPRLENLEGLSLRADAGRPVALVLGAEGPGLSDAVMDAVDLVVSIPMAAGVDSLNVATAAAIAFHRFSGP